MGSVLRFEFTIHLHTMRSCMRCSSGKVQVLTSSQTTYYLIIKLNVPSLTQYLSLVRCAPLPHPSFPQPNP